MTFKVGDRVECVYKGRISHEVDQFGKKARIIKMNGPGYCYVEWEDPETQAYFVRGHGLWGTCEWRKCPTITDWTKVATRAGYPVTGVIQSDTLVTATVAVAGRKLSLSYSADGEFYPGHECPVDLVQS